MGAMKRELERLADIVIYGTPETIQREFKKVEGLADGGAIELVSYAIEMSRIITPLCECGSDYHAELLERFPQYFEDTNNKPIKCTHDYAIEKEVSFCLNCGEFER